VASPSGSKKNGLIDAGSKPDAVAYIGNALVWGTGHEEWTLVVLRIGRTTTSDTTKEEGPRAAGSRPREGRCGGTGRFFVGPGRTRTDAMTEPAARGCGGTAGLSRPGECATEVGGLHAGLGFLA
jgi:hypothetical protein